MFEKLLQFSQKVSQKLPENVKVAQMLFFVFWCKKLTMNSNEDVDEEFHFA